MQECINLVKEKCKIVIKGNCDEFFSSNLDLNEKPIQEINRYNWIRSKLNDESINYLRNLPFCHEFYMSGRLVRLIHAHPEETYKFVGNIDLPDKLYELFLPSSKTISNDKADIVIYGHIHTPFMQKIYNRTIINTGSVGNSIDVFRNKTKDGNVKNTTVANYLILSGNLNSKDINEKISYELVNIPYNIDKELSKNIDNIEYESYQEEIKNGKYRDMEKINKSFEKRGINIDSI